MLILPVIEQMKDDPRVYEAFTTIVDSINSLSQQIGVDARPSQQTFVDRIPRRAGVPITPTVPEGVARSGASFTSPFFNADGRLVAKALTKAAQTFNTSIVFSSLDNDTVQWTGGEIAFDDGAIVTIKAGDTGDMTSLTYIFFDLGTSQDTLQVTTDIARTQGDDVILMSIANGIADPGQPSFFVPSVGVFGLNADLIGVGAIGTINIQLDAIDSTLIADDSISTPKLQANAVTAAKIFANTITATQIAALTITGGLIAANTITAAKLNVATLSAISADFGGMTAGSITGVTITSGLFRTASSGHRIELTAAAQHMRFYNNAGANVGSIDFEEATGRMIFNALGNEMRLLTTSGGKVVIFGGGIGNLTVTSTLVDCQTTFDMSGNNITDVGDVNCDEISKQGGGAPVIARHGFDCVGQNIINVGNLECDSITKDGAGNILFNDIIDMGGRNIDNVGQVILDSLAADATTIQVFNNFEPSGTPNLGGASARWSCFFSVINVSSTTTFGSLAYNWPSTRSAGQQLQTDGGAGLSWAAAGSLREWKDIVGPQCSPGEALEKLRDIPVWPFRYKPGKGTGTKDIYTGIMAEDLPEVMHHDGTIFSEVSGFGYLLLFNQALLARIEKLEKLCQQKGFSLPQEV